MTGKVKIIIAFVLLFIIASTAYAIRLPGKGKFKDITEYIQEVQEEDVTNSRDNEAIRRASEDKKPWMSEDVWDMETTWSFPSFSAPAWPTLSNITFSYPSIEWCLIECPDVIFRDECEDWFT